MDPAVAQRAHEAFLAFEHVHSLPSCIGDIHLQLRCREPEVSCTAATMHSIFFTFGGNACRRYTIKCSFLYGATHRGRQGMPGSLQLPGKLPAAVTASSSDQLWAPGLCSISGQ